jgi:Fe-S-cluster containining protein
VSLVQLGPPQFDSKTGPPCHDCTAKCCKYFALQIDKPTTPKDHDHIRWYLLHEHIAVWAQGDDWFLEVRTPCRHLLPDNRCEIYHTRPQICREYGWPDAESPDAPCEYFTGEGGYDLHFETAEAFSAWSQTELERREERLSKRRKRAKNAKNAIAGLLLALSSVAARADSASDVYKQMGIAVKDVMNSSVATARVIPGDAKQLVAVVTYLTGKKDESNALGVRLDVYRTEGDKLVPLYSRDAAKENGGYVGRGEVAILDLDGDGVSEIGLYYDNHKNDLIQERRLDVIVHDGTGFRVAWSGAVSYDATKAVRDVPVERRDRYLRKLDFSNTRRTKGITLFMTKTMISVAGERLPQPKDIQETFPLKPEAP